jgi:hypothetical protein
VVATDFSLRSRSDELDQNPSEANRKRTRADQNRTGSEPNANRSRIKSGSIANRARIKSRNPAQVPANSLAPNQKKRKRPNRQQFEKLIDVDACRSAFENLKLTPPDFGF